MNEFYSYLSDTDKEFMAIETAFNIEMEKQMLAYEYASKLYDIQVMQSDLKVLTESGTYEDIEELYCEAGKAAEEKKEGIITKIIHGIQSLISSIINAITGIFKGKKDNEVADAAAKAGKTKAKDPNKTGGIISKAVQQINSIVRPGSEITTETANKVAKIVGGATAALGGVALTTVAVKTVHDKKKEEETHLQAFRRLMGELIKNPLKGEGAPAVLKSLGEFISAAGSTAKEHASNVWNSIAKVFKKEKVYDEPVPTSGNKITDNVDRPIKSQDENLDNQTDGYDSARDIVDGDSMMESEELEETMDELGDLFASL